MYTLSRYAAIVAGALVLTSSARAQTNWTHTGSGTFSWTDAINWSAGVPNSNTAVAVFSGAGAGATKTVSIPTATTVTVQQIQINATQSNALNVTGGTIRLRSVGGGGSLAPITVAGYASPVTHTINSNIDFDGSSGSRAITVGSNATLNLAGQFVNTNTNGTFLFTGGGTTVLSGNNAGVAVPIVTAGAGTALTVNGSIGSPVTVGGGTTLNGSGTISGPVTVGGGGKVAGNLTVGSLGLQSGTVDYTTVVGGTPASPVNDKVTINGALTAVAGTLLNFTLVDNGTLVPGGTYTITLLDAVSISGLTAAQVTATASNFGFAGTPVATIDSAAGNVNLTFTVVPEPATTLAVGAVGLGGLWLRRRRVARA